MFVLVLISSSSSSDSKLQSQISIPKQIKANQRLPLKVHPPIPLPPENTNANTLPLPLPHPHPLKTGFLAIGTVASFAFGEYCGSKSPAILNNLHAVFDGCAPTPSQYFARKLSSRMSLCFLPSLPSVGARGIGS